jgi:hypothetical protein
MASRQIDTPFDAGDAVSPVDTLGMELMQRVQRPRAP